MIFASLLLLLEVAGGGTPPQHPLYAAAPYPPVAVSFEGSPQPSTLLAAGEGKVWVIDREAGSLLVWDGQEKKARTLSLPDLGDFKDPLPLFLAAFPGGVWLWDGRGERGFVWFEETWRGPFSLPGKVAGMTALEDGSVVLNTPAHPAGSFAILDRKGTLKARFGSPPAVQRRELAFYYDSWVLCPAGGGFVAAARYLPRLVRYNPDGRKLWETIPKESGLAALEQSRISRLSSFRKDCASGCIGEKLVEFATMGQGFADGSFALVFSRRPQLDWFDTQGHWRKASRFAVSTPVALDPLGLALLGDELWLGINGSLGTLRAVPALVGRVVDPELQPVSGALVSLRVTNGEELQLRSTEDGTFAVSGNLGDLPAKVEVKAEGFLPWRSTGLVRELLGEDLVLEPEPVVCVRVVERLTGTPVKRFSLSVAHLTEQVGYAVYREGPPPLEVENEEGRACLTSQWRPPLQVRVCSQGYACARKRLLAGGEERIQLDREAFLEVQVQDNYGRPVEKAELSLSPEKVARHQRVSDEVFVMTDAKGVATFTGREEGDYVLKVSAQGFLPWSQTQQLKVGANFREVTLEASREVTFVVREASGEPVSGAQVVVETPAPPTGDWPPQCSTDGQGRCAIANLSSGPARVLVRHGPNRNLTEDFQSLPPGEVEIIFPAEGQLEGEVVGTELYPGSPLVVVASQAGFGATAPLGADGHFLFEKLQLGQALVKVEVRDEQGRNRYRWLLASKLVEVGDQGEYLRLELPPPRRVFGKVTAGGRACAGCALVFALESDPTAGWAAVSGPDGSYQALLARPGSYLVRVLHPDTGPQAVRRVAVSGDQRWDVELGGGVLEGYVIMGGTQERVAGASVRVFDAKNLLLGSTVTSSSGAFRLTDLPLGEVRIQASAEGGWGQQSVRLSGADQQVVVELSASKELLFNLVEASTGDLLTGWVFGAVLPEGGAPWKFGQPLVGRPNLRLPALGEGVHTVILFPQKPLAPTTVRVLPNASPKVVALWPLAVLEILLPGGEQASVEVRGMDGNLVALRYSYPFFSLAGTGRISLELPPGTWDVAVRGDAASKVRTTRVTLSPFQRSSILVTWQ